MTDQKNSTAPRSPRKKTSGISTQSRYVAARVETASPAKTPEEVRFLERWLEDYRESQGQGPKRREVEDALENYRAMQKIEAVTANAEAKSSKASNQAPMSWQEIEIAFLSDERIEICSGGSRTTYNYAEFGFADRRSQKPIQAWAILREMSSSDRNGTIPRPLPGKDKTTIQKRIEEIREKLRGHFKIQVDPIPFNGSVYQASFKISRRSSFDT